MLPSSKVIKLDAFALIKFVCLRQVAWRTCKDQADMLKIVDFVLFQQSTFKVFDATAQKLFGSISATT